MTFALVPMSPEEFDRRAAVLRVYYAKDLQDARGISADEALAEAAAAMREVLPDGVHTAHAIVRSAQADGTTVGWVWLTLPGAPGRPGMAWIHNIEIDREHQGKGYGRALLLASEEELRRRGVAKWGLNVFGGNARAIRLYESFGFEVVSQQMVKEIPGASG